MNNTLQGERTNLHIDSINSVSATHPHPPRNSGVHYEAIKESRTESIEKILSTSIQRAKEKISQMDLRDRSEIGKQDRRQDKRDVSRQQKEGSGAIANAMKILQGRIAELERSLQGQERERTIILNELDNVSAEKKMILGNLEETNKKMVILEQSNKALKTELKEVGNRLQLSLTARNQMQSKCKGLELNIRHLQKQKLQLSQSLGKRDGRQGDSALQARMKELQEFQRSLLEKEKKLQQKQRKLGIIEQRTLQQQRKNVMSMQVNTRTYREAEQKNRILQLKLEELRGEIGRLTNQLFLQRERGGNKQSNYEAYVEKINQLEGQLSNLRQTTKFLSQSNASVISNSNSNRKAMRVQGLKEELAELKIKYEEVFHLYKKQQQRLKKDEKQIKAYRNRFWEVKDVLDQIVQKLSKLPQPLTKQLKYLIVKGSKIQSVNFQRTQTLHTLQTPTKSRSNSANRPFKSSSKKVEKSGEKLNTSRQSRNSNSGAKSKRSQNSDKKPKGKKVIMSSRGQQNQNDQNILEKKVQQLKKEYKLLVRELDVTQKKEIRDKLDLIGSQLRQKSEELTKLKQRGRKG